MNGERLRREAIEALQLCLWKSPPHCEIPRVLRAYILHYALKSLDVLEWIPPLEYDSVGFFSPPSGWMWHGAYRSIIWVSPSNVVAIYNYRRNMIKEK